MAELPKGPGAAEQSAVANKPGVYRHPASRARVIILPDSQSTAQSDAVVRLGYEWIAPPPTRQELAVSQAAQAARDAADEEAGKVGAPYLVPGTQEVVYNGTATDVGGPGDALAIKDAEIASLKAQLSDPTPAVPAETQTNQTEGN